MSDDLHVRVAELEQELEEVRGQIDRVRVEVVPERRKGRNREHDVRVGALRKEIKRARKELRARKAAEARAGKLDASKIALAIAAFVFFVVLAWTKITHRRP